jgi:hypothetical protein
MPAIFKGNNKTSGVMLLIAKKNISKVSIFSCCFKLNFNLIKKLKALNLLPHVIKDLKK